VSLTPEAIRYDISHQRLFFAEAEANDERVKVKAAGRARDGQPSRQDFMLFWSVKRGRCLSSAKPFFKRKFSWEWKD